MKIEKGIPITPRKSAGRKSKYPWGEMEVGDSFFVPGAKTAPIRPQKLHEAGMKFTSRSVEGGFRIWRTE